MLPQISMNEIDPVKAGNTQLPAVQSCRGACMHVESSCCLGRGRLHLGAGCCSKRPSVFSSPISFDPRRPLCLCCRRPSLSVFPSLLACKANTYKHYKANTKTVKHTQTLQSTNTIKHYKAHARTSVNTISVLVFLANKFLDKKAFNYE